jgi:3-oxoacyl-[acyl-carrier-protein] synthase-3
VSSNYFVKKFYNAMLELGMDFPEEKWFMNLHKVGNVGAASIYLMVDELMRSGNLKKGEKILLIVPESGRFSYAHAYLTVH